MSERDAHPDEGTIHAWLDRQLDATQTDALEAHLQRCDACAERVAEARGLIAGASRIVSALDIGQPPITGTAPGAASWPPVVLPTTRARGLPAFRLTPTRSAIAAVLVVAVGMAIVHEHQRPSARNPIAAGRAAGPAPASVPMVATSPVIPSLDSTAAARVAAARTFAKAQQETTVNADRARVAEAAASPTPEPVAQSIAAARVADSVTANRMSGARVAAATADVSTNAAPVAAPAPVAGVAGGVARGVIRAPAASSIEAPQCYRVESATGAAAMWGPVPLPFVLALDAPAMHNSARVLPDSGDATGVFATFERRANDSLVFTLRRIGYTGTLTVGAPGEVRAGVLRSGPTRLALSEAVVTAAPSAGEKRQAERKRAASQPRADSAPAAAQRDASAQPAVPVVVRKVGCTP